MTAVSGGRPSERARTANLSATMGERGERRTVRDSSNGLAALDSREKKERFSG